MIITEKDIGNIYLENRGEMFSVARRILHNREDAEDAVQRAFLQLLISYNNFRGESKISTYLHTVVVRESLMMLRSKERKVKKTPLEHKLQNGELAEIPELAVNGNHYEYGTAIEKAVSRLPDGYRKAWILHDYLGCKCKEVAELLGYSIGNSKSQLCRARKKLRETLNSHGKLQQQKNIKKFNLYETAKILQQEFLHAHPEINRLIS